jgi:hypothetical protein
MFGSARKLFRKIGLQNNSRALSSSMELPLTHEFRGRGSFACLIPLLLAGHSAWALNPHPRIWLDAEMLSDLSAKVGASDADWLAVLSDANSSPTTRLPPVVSVIGATNASPVQFTTSGILPLNSGANIIIAGGTGAWAGVNGTAVVIATVTGTHTFTVPINSTGFGSFSGQTITVFVNDGCATNFMCYTGGNAYLGSAWYRYIVGAALVYQVTGTTSYRDYVISWIDYINSISAAGITKPVSTETGYPSRFVAPTVGLAYDWCFSGLSTAQKNATIVTAHVWFNWVSVNAFAISGGDAVPNANYTGGHILGMGIMGYAIYDEDAGASTLVNWASTLWNNAISQGFSAPIVGNQYSYMAPYGVGVYYSGVVPEFNYDPSHIVRLMEYQLAVKTATGSAFPTAVTNGAKLFATSLLYDLKPDRWRTRTNGTYSGNVSGVFIGALPLVLSYVLTGDTEGGWMQWMFQHFGTPAETTYSPYILADTSDGRLDRTLFYRPSASGIDYRTTQPTYRFAPGSSFRTFWRSDWTDLAVWFMFHGSAEDDGQGYSAGDIELTRGPDQLIVNSQNWNGTSDGVIGSPNIFTSGADSGYTSSLYCDAGGAYFPCTSVGKYWGGQGQWGKYVAPLAQKESLGYVLADVTNAYDNPYNATTRALRYWYRETVAMGDGTVIVWDRVKMLNTTYLKHLRWQLSSAGTPTKTGNVASNVVGSSAIFIAPVLPASPSVNIVRNLNGGGQAVNWRVEVNDNAGGTDLNALTVLYATASNGSLPATAALGTIDANHVGVQIADTTPKVVIFAAPVADKGSGKYAPNTYNSVTFTTTHAGTGKYLIAGLVPGAYSVRLNGVAIPGYASVIVAADGTLFFAATAGAFSVLPSSVAPANSCDLNGDGVVNSADVQIAVSQALRVTPCGSAALNGVCNVVDLQRIVNAANGQACKVGQ